MLESLKFMWLRRIMIRWLSLFVNPGPRLHCLHPPVLIVIRICLLYLQPSDIDCFYTNMCTLTSCRMVNLLRSWSLEIKGAPSTHPSESFAFQVSLVFIFSCHNREFARKLWNFRYLDKRSPPDTELPVITSHAMSIQPGRSTPSSLSSQANSEHSRANSIAIVDEVEPPTPAYIPPSNDTSPIQFSYVQYAGLQHTQLHRHSEIPNSEYGTLDSTTLVEPPMPAYFPPSNDILPIQSSSSDAVFLEYTRLHRYSEIPLPSGSRQREYTVTIPHRPSLPSRSRRREHTLPHRHSLPSRFRQREHTLPQRHSEFSFKLPSNCGACAAVVGIGGLIATVITIICCCCHNCCCCCCCTAWGW